jgi:hypothetical protein
LTNAILYNQPDSRFRDFWQDEFLKERELGRMPDYVARGLIGLAHMGMAPNVEAIVEGVNKAKQWNVDCRLAIKILDRGFRGVWSEFPSDVTLRVRVVEAAPALEDSWSFAICGAWKQSLSGYLPQAGNLRLVQNVEKVAARAAACEAG